MTINELRKLDTAKLDSHLLDLRREQFNLRMQHGSGQLDKPAELTRVRREIARVKTLLTQSANRS